MKTHSSATLSGLFQMKQEINGWIIAKFTTEQKSSLDAFLTSFQQAYDLFLSADFPFQRRLELSIL